MSIENVSQCHSVIRPYPFYEDVSKAPTLHGGADDLNFKESWFSERFSLQSKAVLTV